MSFFHRDPDELTFRVVVLVVLFSFALFLAMTSCKVRVLGPNCTVVQLPTDTIPATPDTVAIMECVTP